MHSRIATEKLTFVFACKFEDSGRKQSPQRFDIDAISAGQRDDARTTFPLLNGFYRLANELGCPIIAHLFGYPDLRRNNVADTASMIAGGIR